MDCKPFDKKDKMRASAISAAIAAVVAVIVFSPVMFGLVSDLGLPVQSLGQPTMTGLLIHGLVTFLIVGLIFYYIMKPDQDQQVCDLLG